jgi:RimK family alpha-L-glutamate ligase
VKTIILGQRGGRHVTLLQKALARRGIAAPCLPITRLAAYPGGKPGLYAPGEDKELQSLDEAEVVFVRAIPGGSLEQVIFRVSALHCLEQYGKRVINPPTAIERGVDKYFTLCLLARAGLPVPRTMVTERVDQAMAAFEELGGDVVVKPLFGSEGRGMTRVTDPDTALRVFKALELGHYVYYLQEYLDHGREDIRIFVIGGKAVAAMRRKGNGWKTNIAAGAVGEALELDDGLVEMGLKASAVLGADYAGVDVLPCADGYRLVEVNTIPAWSGLKKATGVDVAELLVNYVYSG